MYSAIVSDHFYNPRRVGPLEGATHVGTAGVPGEGPYLLIWLRVGEDKVISAAAYQTHGCPAAMASGSIIAQLVEGMSLEQAAQIDEVLVVESLAGLPEGKEHCPRLAVQALRNAIVSLPSTMGGV